MKASFVGQGKRGFSCHIEIIKAKIGENQAKSGFGAVSRLLRSPIFCFQRSKITQNTGVHFGSFYAARNPKKCSDNRARTICRLFDSRFYHLGSKWIDELFIIWYNKKTIQEGTPMKKCRQKDLDKVQRRLYRELWRQRNRELDFGEVQIRSFGKTVEVHCDDQRRKSREGR